MFDSMISPFFGQATNWLSNIAQLGLPNWWPIFKRCFIEEVHVVIADRALGVRYPF